VPFSGAREALLEFESFDGAYVERLRAGDPRTHEHFCSYFGRLIQLKLRSRLAAHDDREDVRQETFKRFFMALQLGRIEHPERLGSYVNSVCNNVLKEHYRRPESHNSSIDDGAEACELFSPTEDPLTLLGIKDAQQKVRETLEELTERERRILREILLEERDKDEVCRDFGVTREHLRLLLHRAKKSFRKKYGQRCA
jgi:RNA polymerase sigma-70 factor, ECF subfamily